jgi:hypothetical protein
LGTTRRLVWGSGAEEWLAAGEIVNSIAAAGFSGTTGPMIDGKNVYGETEWNDRAGDAIPAELHDPLG